MTTLVLLGGNGYIGREISRQWCQRDSQIQIYTVSRSGKNSLQTTNIHNLQADVTDYQAVLKQLPERVDYIVDLVGGPNKDPQQLINNNQKPAEVMLKIAENKHVKAMGIISGRLGDASFVKIKAAIIKQLKQSPIPLAYVEPTLVYGAGRADALAKMVPLLKFFGLFSKKFKPVPVEEVAQQLINQLLEV